MIRVAIVGLGGYGWELVRWIRQAGPDCGARLVAAADERLAELSERTESLRQADVELFDDAGALFRALRGRCEAVYVATGIASHAELTVAAARAGYHVHLEKPAAATVQEVDRMAAALREAGRICLVGFQALHSDDIRFVKDRIVSGRLGQVQTVACEAGWPRRRSYYTRNNWAGRLRLDGAWVLDGPATNALAHQIANVLFLCSPQPGQLATPAAVRAELYATAGFDSHNLAAIEIRTGEGPTGCFVCAHCSESTFGPTIRVQAERGDALWTLGEGARITYEDGTTETCAFDDRQQLKMVANFIEAVRAGDGSGLRCDLARARRTTLALDGAHESSARIHRIGDERTRLADAGTDRQRVIVEGLDDVLRAAGARACLFSDLDPAPPWATPTRPYDLAGYASFPQQFQAGP